MKSTLSRLRRLFLDRQEVKQQAPDPAAGPWKRRWWLYTQAPRDRYINHWSMESAYDSYEELSERAEALSHAFKLKVEEQWRREMPYVKPVLPHEGTISPSAQDQ